MTAIIPNPTQQKEAFMERLLKSASGTFDMFTIYIGDRLGFYQALANSFGLTSVELATRPRQCAASRTERAREDLSTGCQRSESARTI